MSVLAEEVAELAAEEARRLVQTVAGLLTRGEEGVLEAIERAAQKTAAQIGLVAVAGIVDWAGAHTPPRVSCPHPDHPGTDHPGTDHPDAGQPGQLEAGRGARLVARRTKTVRTLLGSIEVTRGYYHCGSCRHGFAPLDTRLGLAGTSLSPGLARALPGPARWPGPRCRTGSRGSSSPR